jgi:ADP-ribose pyrophosphatase YjhB (NUDIX family)
MRARSEAERDIDVKLEGLVYTTEKVLNEEVLLILTLKNREYPHSDEILGGTMENKPVLSVSNSKNGLFFVVSLGIIFDTEKRMILIGKRINDPYVQKLSWSFPGGVPPYDEDTERHLEKVIKRKTGVEVKNLGCIFARILNDNNNILLMYYLCELVGGKEKAMDDMVELKWVKPEELEKYFTTSFDPRLKEYILHLK